MVFQTKKVPLETLGEYLNAIRGNLNLSLAEVAEKTGIGEKYLAQLEASQYSQLPPDVYTLGFLRKLADLYSVSESSLLAQYKKERGIIEQVANSAAQAKTGWRSWFGRIIVTPKLITLTSGVTLVVLALLYLVIQVSAINRTPSLKVFGPIAGSIVKGSIINVSGQADPGSEVAINGEQVFVDTAGKFDTNLSAAVGQKELVITAQNKFGKKAEQKLLVMVENSVAAAQANAPENVSVTSGLNLELKFKRDTTIDINRDGVDLAKETVPADGTKTIQADSKIILTTSDAGSVVAVLNGKELGVLGRAKESLTIPFTAESLANN